MNPIRSAPLRLSKNVHLPFDMLMALSEAEGPPRNMPG